MEKEYNNVRPSFKISTMIGALQKKNSYPFFFFLFPSKANLHMPANIGRASAAPPMQMPAQKREIPNFCQGSLETCGEQRTCFQKYR
jgi:hypothetical protein